MQNPKIHNKFLRYLDDVAREIGWWISYSRSTFEDIYWLLLEETIENRIETVGFEISDLKLNVDYSAIVNLLMGEKVYGNKKYGLRELIQNSLDACKVMREYAPQLECYKYDEYVPKIQIILDYSNNQLRIRDNGIGMSEEVLKNIFLTLGNRTINLTTICIREINIIQLEISELVFWRVLCYQKKLSLKPRVLRKTRDMH